MPIPFENKNHKVKMFGTKQLRLLLLTGGSSIPTTILKQAHLSVYQPLLRDNFFTGDQKGEKQLKEKIILVFFF